jgi:hypothetical protein
MHKHMLVHACPRLHSLALCSLVKRSVDIARFYDHKAVSTLQHVSLECCIVAAKRDLVEIVEKFLSQRNGTVHSNELETIVSASAQSMNSSKVLSLLLPQIHPARLVIPLRVAIRCNNRRAVVAIMTSVQNSKVQFSLHLLSCVAECVARLCFIVCCLKASNATTQS